MKKVRKVAFLLLFLINTYILYLMSSSFNLYINNGRFVCYIESPIMFWTFSVLSYVLFLLSFAYLLINIFKNKNTLFSFILIILSVSVIAFTQINYHYWANCLWL